MSVAWDPTLLLLARVQNKAARRQSHCFSSSTTDTSLTAPLLGASSRAHQVLLHTSPMTVAVRTTPRKEALGGTYRPAALSPGGASAPLCFVAAAGEADGLTSLDEQYAGLTAAVEERVPLYERGLQVRRPAGEVRRDLGRICADRLPFR